MLNLAFFAVAAVCVLQGWQIHTLAKLVEQEAKEMQEVCKLIHAMTDMISRIDKRLYEVEDKVRA